MEYHDAIDRYGFERDLRNLPQQDLIEQLGVYDILKRQGQLFLKDLLYSTSLHQARMINLVDLKDGRYITSFDKIAVVSFSDDNKVLVQTESRHKMYVLGKDAFSTIGNAKAEARRRNEQLNLYPTRPVDFNKDDAVSVKRKGTDNMDDVNCPRCGSCMGDNESFYEEMCGREYIYCRECGQKVKE